MLVVEEDGAHERLRAVVSVGLVGAHWAAAQWQRLRERRRAGDDRGDPATPRQRESSIGCTERTPRASRGSMLFTYH